MDYTKIINDSLKSVFPLVEEPIMEEILDKVFELSDILGKPMNGKQATEAEQMVVDVVTNTSFISILATLHALQLIEKEQLTEKLNSLSKPSVPHLKLVKDEHSEEPPRGD